ncbi:MAG: succinate dehydrogenase, cytochrome b556 subunit [Pseudomonadota bacterium]
MKTKRPVHLNLTKIKLPIGGITSILHRITGVYLFLALPVLLYLLDQSLHTPEAMQYVAGPSIACGTVQ